MVFSKLKISLQVMQKFQEGDIQGAIREADLFADEGIAKRVQQDIETVTSPSMDSWDAVAIVKKNAGTIRRCAEMWTLFNTRQNVMSLGFLQMCMTTC